VGHREGHGPGQGQGHGHGHGHGAESKFSIPDWKQYKVDGIKDLEWTRKALADKGLRDPWLRNEVWRYSNWPGFGRSAFMTISRGFKYAAAAMVVTIAVDQVLGISKSKQHHHEGGHKEGEEGVRH